MNAQRKEGVMTDDTRLALLEQSIGHINETMIRIEKRFDAIDFRFDRMEKRLDSIEERVSSGFIRLDQKIDSNFQWLLGIYIGGFASLFGIVAHGFNWI